MCEWLAEHYQILKDFAGPTIALLALIATSTFAFAGLKTFQKWQREKVTERRIEVAYEALSIAYESEMIFDDIRRRFIHGYEFADMKTEGMSPGEVDRVKSYWAILRRFERHIDYFDRTLKLQPRFMAAFGRDKKDTFFKLYRARNMIQTATDMLMNDLKEEEREAEAELVAQLRADIWDHTGPKVKDPKRVTKLLEEFVAEIEAVCLPLVEHRYDRKRG
jgi:hypothetical protein